MLETLGIPSRMVVLRMHHLGRLAPHPASLAVFNHAILYVPGLDLYLDGTAEFSGSSELPASDEGAQVLVVEEDGRTPSRLSTTPYSASERNLTRTGLVADLAPDGSAKASGTVHVTGQAAAGYRQHYESDSGRRERFEQHWARAWPGARAGELSMGDLRALESPVDVRFTLQLPRMAVQENGALVLSPFGEPMRYVDSLAPLSSRKMPVDAGSPSRAEFRHVVRLPAGSAVEEPPAAFEKSGPFGAWRAEYSVKDGALVVEGFVSFAAPRIEPAQYAEYRAFLGELDRALSRRLHVVRMTQAQIGKDEG